MGADHRRPIEGDHGIRWRMSSEPGEGRVIPARAHAAVAVGGRLRVWDPDRGPTMIDHPNESLPRCVCGDFRYEHGSRKIGGADRWLECRNPRCACKEFVPATNP